MDTNQPSITTNQKGTFPLKFYIQNITKYFFSILIILSAVAILVLSVASVIVFIVYAPATDVHLHEDCTSECSFKIIETIPANVNLKRIEGTNTTFEIFDQLLGQAKESIKISSNFFHLQNKRTDGREKMILNF
jgi:hypothetical protein